MPETVVPARTVTPVMVISLAEEIAILEATLRELEAGGRDA